MAIKGLTDQKPRLPEIGKLRKGAEKPERGPGRDLDHFRFAATDPDAQAAFLAAYGKEPREIDGVFPYPTLEENFEAWQEHHVKSALQHRCNGEFCVRWLDPATNQYVNDPQMLQKKPCPGNCKQAGKLRLILPKLGRLAVVTAVTTSIYDIASIHASMCDLDNRKIGNSMMNIPVILRRVLQEVPVTIDGKKSRAKKWLLQVEAHPAFVRAALAAGEAMALTGAAPRLQLGEVAPLQLTTSLPDDAPVEEEEGEVLEAEAVEENATVSREDAIELLHKIWPKTGKTEAEWEEFKAKNLTKKSVNDMLALADTWAEKLAAKAA